jgi:putative ABC transport system permease protein
VIIIIFIQNLNLGFNKDNLVYFQIINNSTENINLLKNELLKNPDILNVTSGNILSLMNKQHTDRISWEEKNPNDHVQSNIQRVDYDFLKTYEAQMKEGRFFSEDFPTDKTSAFVYETAHQLVDIWFGRNACIWDCNINYQLANMEGSDEKPGGSVKI